MDPKATTTKIVSRGRLTGLLRSPSPAGTGQNRTSHTDRRGQAPVDEALYYRARLILGDIPRPSR